MKLRLFATALICLGTIVFSVGVNAANKNVKKDKKVFVLAHDYWHHFDSIEPLVKMLFDDGYDVTFTEKPSDYKKGEYGLFVSFKDPIENDQIPTPVWCDANWTPDFLADVENGMGVVLLHAAVTDLPEGHDMLTNIVRSTFVRHPAPCPVTFTPTAEHSVLKGIEEFTFPNPEEHYVMNMLPDAKTTVIANTVSKNGTQPALWVHEYGKGRICCITPAHTTANLTYEPFVKLMKNAISWVSER